MSIAASAVVQPKYVQRTSARFRARKLTLRAAETQRKAAAREKLIEDHLGLVRSIAIRVRETLPAHVELEDLIHSGVLGLLDAASRFDPDKQVAFAGYAKFRIRGAVLDSLRELDWASRDLRRRSREIDSAVHELTGVLGRMPNETELALHLHLDLTTTRQLLQEIQCCSTISADSRARNSSELPSPEYACERELLPDRMCARSQSREMLDRALHVLSPRYRQVMVLYYEHDKTMKEIGTVLGINESRVSQIHKAALEKMGESLRAAGIRSSAVI